MIKEREGGADYKPGSVDRFASIRGHFSEDPCTDLMRPTRR